MSWHSSVWVIRGAGSKAWPSCSTAASTAPPPNGRPAGRPCVFISVWKILKISLLTSNAASTRWPLVKAAKVHKSLIGNRPIRKSRRLSRRCGASATHDELQIAQIHEYTECLPNDENGILSVKSVTEQHQSAANGEHPERGWYYTFSGTFGGNPLHDKTHGEHHLRDVAD